MPSDKISAATRRYVATRAKNYCEYCQCPENVGTQSFTVEHIKPRKDGGENIVENLAWSCFGCNSHKHTKTVAIDPKTNLQVSLFHPRQQNWIDHFYWNDDFTMMMGKTDVGRATIESLFVTTQA